MGILKEYQMRCNSCGQIFDIRDLSQVFAHEECNGIPVDYEKLKKIPYSWCHKVGSSELSTKKVGTIHIN